MTSPDHQRPMGARIYNLFPTLLGPVPNWHQRLPAIADMGFDWIFLNPVQLPGASGSLYSIKDPERLNPALRPAGQGADSGPGTPPMDDDRLLRAFCAAAQAHGIRVMLDLVINHSARDSVLVDAHPAWFARDAHGHVRSPFVRDLDDGDKVTVWEDLAELDYSERPARDAMLRFWEQQIGHYLGLGFAGFRCDAAYKLPADVWRRLIGSARRQDPQACFFAETLGAPQEAVEQLRGAGFDYLFNSAKWWDFRAGWLLDQYQRFRGLAPSVAFPESHDTERLAAESGGSARESRFKYLFAAVFSAGVMMPIGYELGFRRALHVVQTTPDDWAQGCAESPFDISDYIARVNAMKADTPVLCEEGPQERVTDPHEPLVGLLRRTNGSAQRSLALINPDPAQPQPRGVGQLADALGCAPADIREITPAIEAGGHTPPPDLTRQDAIEVPPRSLRIFVCD
ncbi:alpha-amylase family glycosyl hydrolase [uncultured Thiohalocapsa sp.]|uniref:alpha-amylase family glycosyl hydrolase n=1 Tax=uncultured Thiohalocapsa sp. TaxID=768990 RepID=UPI0025D0F9B2|nr:alpha-amylase family glycosyl hydrolase [uncultured Thiohalocapsa sp.]